ncbi:MAG: N-acetylmuramic acid 6-phosphate etherase [bacterium]|nr:N-acetylmuramic acid 6-phosphate etherase [bacterium]
MSEYEPFAPDRSGIETEMRDRSLIDLDRLEIPDLVTCLNRADATVAEAVGRASDAIVAFLAAAAPRFADGGRLIYLGAGTSGRLGVLDASECPPTFQVEPDRVVGLIAGGDPALRRSSESREDDPAGAHAELDGLKLTEKDTVLGIAAGGTTPWVRGGLEHASEHAGCVGFLTCAPVSTPRGVGHHIVVRTGPEVLTGSTRMKAGTATKMVLNTISTVLMVRSGRVYENLMVDLRATNAKLRDRAERIVCEATGVDRERASRLLQMASGEAKTAILMEITGGTAPDCRELLERHGGHLRQAIEASRVR